MNRMPSALRTVLFQGKLVAVLLLVLGRGVIAGATFRTCKSNDSLHPITSITVYV